MTQIDYRTYPYGKEHTIVIYPTKLGKKSGYTYSLIGRSKNTGYETNKIGFFDSEYEAFQDARQQIDGPDF